MVEGLFSKLPLAVTLVYRVGILASNKAFKIKVIS